jgi:DNA-binding response OmpR family regulator
LGLVRFPDGNLRTVGVFQAGRRDKKRTEEMRHTPCPEGLMPPSILVVDDEPILVSTWCDALSEEGFIVQGCTDGFKALTAFERGRHNAIVTDLIMPEVEGIEIIRRVRAINPEVKVLAVSGGGRHWAAPTLLRWARNVGADAALQKPLSISTLVGAVRMLLKIEPDRAPH